MKIPSHMYNLFSLVMPDRYQAFRRMALRSTGVKVGRGVHLGIGLRVYGSNIVLGDETWLSPYCLLYSTKMSSIAIGSKCDIGPCVKMICGSHSLGSEERRAGAEISMNIEIGSGCWIGAGSSVMGGARVGGGSVFGAGAIAINRNYAPNGMYCGVPATFKKWLIGIEL